MKYKISKEVIPQDMREELNKKIEFIVNQNLSEEETGVTKEDIFKFENELKRRGINATIRRNQGADIDAACGQLRAKERKEETR